MKATFLYGPRKIKVEDVPEPRIIDSKDAVIKVIVACICGSDLWPYRGYDPVDEKGRRVGHEAVGVVVDVGKDVSNVKPGDFVLMPFAFSDGVCEVCREGIYTSCLKGGFFGLHTEGAQAEAVRIPYADGTLFRLPFKLSENDPLLPSLLTLTDVMGTGHHAAVVAGVKPGKDVAVIGDGAVGLCAVIAARRLGAERIIFVSHHKEREKLAREFGATDIIVERNTDVVVESIRELTKGVGVHCTLECVGTEEAVSLAIRITRPGGAIGRVGVPHHTSIPPDITFFKNIIIGGGPAPTRAYMSELLLDILEGKINPGKVFDVVLPLEKVADGYKLMDERKAIKVLLKP